MTLLRRFVLFSAAFLFTLGVVLALLWQSKLFVVRNIPIEVSEEDADPDVNIDQRLKERIAGKLKNLKGHKIWEVDIENMRSLVSSDEWIQETKIVRVFPNQVRLEIKKKNPILMVLSPRGKLLPVTEDGTILATLGPSLLPDVPVLRGENFFANVELRKRAAGLIRSFPEKGALNKKNIAEISHQKEEGYTLTLVSPKVEVKLGEEKIDLKIARVAQVLDYLSANRMQGRVIDASFSKKVLVRLRKGP